MFPHLFSPLTIGGVTLANRVVSSGHDTVMSDHGQIADRLVAYHEARACGGAGTRRGPSRRGIDLSSEY